MILEPQIWAPDDGVKCIHCNKPYDCRIGGILWQGDQDSPGFKETLICPKCATEVVPAIVRDFMRMECSWHTHKRRMQYIIDAGEKAKQIISYTR